MNENDELSQLEARLFRKVFFVVLAGALGIGGVAGIGGFRPDPFTGDDAIKMMESINQDNKLMKYEILFECRQYVDAYYRPPIPTRIRIKALEDHHSENHPDYKPPTQEWQ